MADISILSRLLDGVQRNVNLSSNTLVVGSLKVGTVSPTELTKTILDRLVALQNGSDVDATYHTHDGRYFTEAELSDATGPATGSDLIGDDDSYTNFTPSAATVKGALEGIDSALASTSDEKVGITAADTTPGYLAAKIQVDTGTNTTNALEESVLSPGGDETLRIRFDASKVDHGALIGLGDDDHTIYTKADGTRAFTGDQSMGSNQLTNVADPLAAQDAATKAYVDGLLDGRSWKQPARVASTANIDLAVAADPSPVDGVTLANGDRVLLKNQTTPAQNGIYVAVDADDPTTWVRASDANTGLELESAAVFVAEGTVSNNFQFAQTADSITLGTTALVWVVTSANSFSGHDMISLTGGQISVDLASDAGLESSNPGNSAGQLRVKLDGSTLARSSSGTKVADGGITGTQLNASVAGDGLDGGAGSALSVNVTEIAGSGLENDGSNNLRIAAAAAGDGLQGGGGSALAIDVSDFAGSGLEDDGSENLRIAASAAGAGLTGGGGSALSVVYAPSIQAAGEIAGEAYSATTLYAVRYGQNAETAGRVYKADNDATSTDNFHAIGLVLTVGALSASDSMPNVFKSGLMTATGHGFTVGKPVWLSASGALTSTAPSASNTAVVKLGMVKNANTIDVQIQIMGVN
jgi:hypothetical protein